MKIAELLFSVLNSCRQPSGDRNVVRSYRYTVIQSKAAVVSSAKHHCIPFQQPHARRCLTRIDDQRTRSVDRAHELTRYRGDCGQSLDKIQRHSSAGYQDIGKTNTSATHLTRVNLLALTSNTFTLL